MARHIGPRPADVEHMLQTLGYDSLEALVDTAVPAGIRQPKPLELPAPLTESAVLEQLREIAGRNVMKTQMIGQGFSDTVTPGVILRKVLENPAWYTAYTPYQPEISQGRLEALLNYQTMVQDLTGLDIANASLLDEASAAAEAVLLMHRANRRRTDGVTLLDADLFPQTLSVVRLRAGPWASTCAWPTSPQASRRTSAPRSRRRACAASCCSSPATPAASTTTPPSSRRPRRPAPS